MTVLQDRSGERRQNSLQRGNEKKTFAEWIVVAENFAAAKFAPRVRGEFAEQFVSRKSALTALFRNVSQFT